MRLFSLFIVLNISLTVAGQNIPSPTLYIADNQYFLSPAWAGIGDSFQFRALGQWQWLDVQDAPRTYYVSLNGRLTDRAGFGLIASDDENGFTDIRSITATYAYHLILDAEKFRFLSFGLSYRYSQFNVDTSAFVAQLPDPAISGDRNLDESNFDVGVLYRANGFYASLNAIDILNRSKSDFAENEPLSISQINFLVGYEFDWIVGPVGYLVMEPSLNYHYFSADGRAETDLNLKLTQEYRDWEFWGGFTSRFQTDESEFEALSLTPMAGLKYLGFYFAYGYQTFFTDASAFRNNTHLLSIGFEFGKNPSSCLCTQTSGIR